MADHDGVDHPHHHQSHLHDDDGDREAEHLPEVGAAGKKIATRHRSRKIGEAWSRCSGGALPSPTAYRFEHNAAPNGGRDVPTAAE